MSDSTTPFLAWEKKSLPFLLEAADGNDDCGDSARLARVVAKLAWDAGAAHARAQQRQPQQGQAGSPEVG